MDEEFELPVIHNGKEILFPARLLTLGYIYKIEVDIEGVLVQFEKDDERNWRGILADPAKEPANNISKQLINDVMSAIEEVFA
jgi:hypothetical protein